MIKLTFELYPEDGRIKPYEHPYGYIFRGVIMKWLHEIKPELVHVFHEREKIRPYSVNFIIHKKTPKLELMLTTYNDDLNDTLLNDLIANERVSLTLGQKHYYISKIQFERINLRDLMESSNPVKLFHVRFIRPVYFNTSMGDFPVRFPIPSIFFGNLSHIWNNIMSGDCEIDLGDFQDWINAHVYASSYNMRSVRSDIGKPKPVVGGIGNVSYAVSKLNKKYYLHVLESLEKNNDYEHVNQDFSDKCRWLDILCKLGEHTNVGANRTAAMGVMRYYPKDFLSKSDLLVKE